MDTANKYLNIYAWALLSNVSVVVEELIDNCSLLTLTGITEKHDIINITISTMFTSLSMDHTDDTKGLKKFFENNAPKQENTKKQFLKELQEKAWSLRLSNNKKAKWNASAILGVLSQYDGNSFMIKCMKDLGTDLTDDQMEFIIRMIYNAEIKDSKVIQLLNRLKNPTCGISRMQCCLDVLMEDIISTCVKRCYECYDKRFFNSRYDKLTSLIKYKKSLEKNTQENMKDIYLERVNRLEQELDVQASTIAVLESYLHDLHEELKKVIVHYRSKVHDSELCISIITKTLKVSKTSIMMLNIRIWMTILYGDSKEVPSKINQLINEKKSKKQKSIEQKPIEQKPIEQKPIEEKVDFNEKLRQVLNETDSYDKILVFLNEGYDIQTFTENILNFYVVMNSKRYIIEEVFIKLCVKRSREIIESMTDDVIEDMCIDYPLNRQSVIKEELFELKAKLSSVHNPYVLAEQTNQGVMYTQIQGNNTIQLRAENGIFIQI